MPTAAPPRQTVTAHLIMRDAAAAIDFYRRAFGAVELYRLVEPSGKIGHAQLRIGNSELMLCDEYPDFGALSAPTIGGSPIKFLLYVEDADQAMRTAIDAGAVELRPVRDQFYGDRSGMVMDPFGFSWSIATPKEQVSPEEMQRRFSAALTG
ncbi:MAG: VOC family protein [Gemmatimonadota bacterium]